MRRLIYLFFILVSAEAFANTQQLERRIYYFSRQTDLFKTICFDANGRFREHAVMYEQGGSIRDTSVDCDAQVIALENERKAIEEAIQAGGASCDTEITDTSLAAFANGMTDIAEQVSCPATGDSGLQCVEKIACNLASSLVPRFARDVKNFLQGRSNNSNCGSDGGGNCIENLLAGAVFNVKDTGCGIASLFGYNCDEPPQQNSDQVASDAAHIANFQSNEEVASFKDDPIGWMKQTAAAIFKQMAESIAERFGCAQWENPNLPYASKCLRPQSWSCADCSAKTNMVCGVLGYIGGEIAVSFFTGAAVGVVARAASRIAIEAVEHFPALTARVVSASGRAVDRATTFAALSARWARRGGASVRNIWSGIASTRPVQVLNSIAERVGTKTVATGRRAAQYVVSANDFARRRFFGFGTGQDFVVNSAKTFNQLSEEAFLAGFRATGTAHSNTITSFMGLYPKASDIRSGAYAKQGIRNENDYLRVSTKGMSESERARFSVVVTRDGADSRVVLVDSRGAQSGVGEAYDLTGEAARRPANITAPVLPRRPEVITNPAAEVVEVAPIVVNGNRNLFPLSEYPVIPASTKSQDEVVRALGGNNSYNQELARLSRDEFRTPRNFDNAAYELHEAWRNANPQLRQSRPELFVDYDDLPKSEKLRYANDLERGFRQSNPALIESRGFTEYRASINSPDGSATVTANNVVAPVNEVTDTRRATSFENNAITVGGVTPNRIVAATPNPVVPVTPSVTDDLVTDLTTGRVTTRTTRGENALMRFGGEHVSYQDREIILDILLGGPRKDTYFAGRSAKPPAFQARYSELEAQILRDPQLPRLKTEVEALTLDRIAVGNQKTAEELADIERQGIRAQKRDIPCSAFANVTPGAFPAEGNCKRVKFDQEVNGRYCSCGGMGKTTFTWLVRCPTSTADFRSLATYVDELALPFDSVPEMCTKVDIPRGKECYIGPTSATFAGFGGTTQILCEHRPPRSPAGQADVARYGLDFGGQSVKPVRWSPFTSHAELQEIIQRASTACTTVCDVNEYRSLRQRYDQAIATLRQGASPSELARLEVEARGFDQYMRELGEGRKTYPTSNDLSPATPAPEVPGTPQRAVGGSTTNRLGPPPPPAVVIAAIREKNLQHVRLTPEQTAYIDELVEKRNGSEMSIDDIIEQMDNRSGVQNPARPFRGDRITSFFPNGTGPDDVMEAYSRGDLRFITSNGSTRKFQGEVNGNRYTMYVCEAETCVANGITVRRNEVTSISPECGPGIRALPRLARAKDVLRQSTPITRDSFFVPMPCSN